MSKKTLKWLSYFVENEKHSKKNCQKMLEPTSNVYIIGKDTPNKLKLAQMFGGKDKFDEAWDGKEKLEVKNKMNETFYIRIIPEDEAETLTKDKNVPLNRIFYVYDVDDRKTFEKYEKVHQILKEKFTDVMHDRFILFGISCDIKNERTVSTEELFMAASKNQSSFHELQKFCTSWDPFFSYFDGSINEVIYFIGSEQSRYKDILDEISNEKNNFRKEMHSKKNRGNETS